MRRTIGVFVVLAVVVEAAWSGDANADAQRGQLLSEQSCSQCHGVGPAQPSPNLKAPAFSAIAAERSATDYSLHVFLRTPHFSMPNFVLKPDDVDDIVSYIASLKSHR